MTNKQDEIRMSPVREDTSSNIESQRVLWPTTYSGSRRKRREPTHYQRAATHCCAKPLNRLFAETTSWCSKSDNAFISFLLRSNLPQMLIESFSFWVLTDINNSSENIKDRFFQRWPFPLSHFHSFSLRRSLQASCRTGPDVWFVGLVRLGPKQGKPWFLRWFAMVYQAIGATCFRQDSVQDRAGSFQFDLWRQIQQINVHTDLSCFDGYGVLRPSPLHSIIVLCGLCCPFNDQRFASKFEPTLKL